MDGRVLEAAYAFGAETLVVATDDVPFEDGLHVSLVTTTTVIDWLAQSAPYATGVFREIGLVGATLDFAFLGERALRLRVLAAPCLHVPMLFDRGDAFAWRPLRARTRLRLERRPRR
ncbi:MAG: hypothetical protein ACFBWO_18395 [Paracoccaceae bacterium]